MPGKVDQRCSKTSAKTAPKPGLAGAEKVPCARCLTDSSPYLHIAIASAIARPIKLSAISSSHRIGRNQPAESPRGDASDHPGFAVVLADGIAQGLAEVDACASCRCSGDKRRQHLCGHLDLLRFEASDALQCNVALPRGPGGAGTARSILRSHRATSGHSSSSTYLPARNRRRLSIVAEYWSWGLLDGKSPFVAEPHRGRRP